MAWIYTEMQGCHRSRIVPLTTKNRPTGGRFLPTCFETQTFTLTVPDSIAKSKNKPADLAGLFLEDCIHGWIAMLHITAAAVSGWVAAEPLTQIVAGRYVLAPGVYCNASFFIPRGHSRSTRNRAPSSFAGGLRGSVKSQMRVKVCSRR